jgi:hypothetical protein
LLIAPDERGVIAPSDPELEIMFKASGEHRHTATKRQIELIRAAQIDREITGPRYEISGRGEVIEALTA